VKPIAVVAHTGKLLGGGLGELRDLLSAEGQPDPLWYEVDKSRKVPKRISRAVDDGAALILVWGGDGTVQQAIDALPSHEPPPLAVLPAGTANLFATNLGIPKDLPQAVAVALHGEERLLDVGRINGERFAVMAGAGFDAEMIAEADRGMKDRVGRVAYAWTGLRATRTGRQRVTVDVEGQRWFSGKASCVLVGNLGTIVGGISAFEDARPDDGRLEVGVVTAAGPWQWSRVLARMAVGRSENSKLVQMTSGRRIDVRLSKKTPYELDGGDRPPTRRLKIRTEPAAISVRVPVPASTMNGKVDQ
jgi:YegS/Rv2252/BmrU family lipid kinase